MEEIFSITNDLGLKRAVKDGKANTNTIIVENNGIKIEITAAVSDTYRTVFELRFYGINQKKNDYKIENIKLIDDDGNIYQEGNGGYEIPQSSKKFIINIWTFEGGPGKDTNLHLSFDGIDSIEGKWEFTIPVKFYPEKSYEANIKYESKNEIWVINKITTYSSVTILEGAIEKSRNFDWLIEIEDDIDNYKDYMFNVPEMKFPTSFKCSLEPMDINGDIKIRIVSLDLNKNDENYIRAIINIPFDQLQEIPVQK